MPPTAHHLRPLLIALVIVFAPHCVATAFAQASTAVVELSNKPIVRESLGLRLYLPLGAEAQTYEIGTQSSLAIALPDELGIINIQGTATVPETTLDSICDGIIRNRLSIDPPRQLPRPGQRMGRGALLARQPNLSITQQSGPTLTAERLYLALEDSASSAAVMGYTVFKPSPTRVLTFELITDPTHYTKAREMYELTVASATIEDPGEIAETRRLGIETGTRWLQDVDQERLTKAVETIGEKWNWQRLYKPSLRGGGDDAAQEIGYRRINARIGRRGDLRRNTNISAGGRDNQRGYIIRIESRSLHQSLIIDSSAVFFLSLDKNEETWSVEMAIRDTKTGQLQRSTELGIREGNDLTVSTRLGDAPLVTSKPQIEGPAYLSRVESFLLPILLVQTGLPADYRFYSFQSQSGRIQMRADSLEPLDNQRAAWKLTTRLSQDTEPQVELLDADGKMIRTQLDDGGRWEPIELARLGRLWRSKRLPMN